MLVTSRGLLVILRQPYGIAAFFVLMAALSLRPAWGGEVAGKVIFAAGDAALLRGMEELVLELGTEVREGDRLETGPDSHIHLRMEDGAFISLRSESALSILQYRFHPSDPARSQANITLHHGVARSVTGEIGARSKDSFRLDTPVAAIGIRGTDFSAMASSQLSRLSVRSGGVIMAPLSSQCRAGTLGPCSVPAAAELFDSMTGAMLEYSAGNARTRVTYDGIRPDDYRPPHPREEGFHSAGQRQSSQHSALARGESAPGAASYEEAIQQAERYLAQPGLITDAYARGEAAPDIQPRDREAVAAPKINWGRWNHLDNHRDVPYISRLITANGRYAGRNDVFGLVEQDPGQRRLPESGRAHFNLNRYEAYIKHGADTLESASISHPGLVVDFEQQRFATRLDVHAASLPGPVHVLGGGRLLPSGHLRSDAESPSHIEGVLSSHASEAGLLFQYQISPGTDAVGATHWTLDRE